MISVASASLSDGLVAYYPFNGNANDASGNGNNGTVYGAIQTNDRLGNPNSAYSFNGASDYIDIGSSGLFNFTSGMTFAVWINPAALPVKRSFIIDKWVNSVEDKHLYFLPDSRLEFYLHNCFNVGGDFNLQGVSSVNPIALNQWTFIVATYDGTSINLYLNGNLNASETVSQNCVSNSTGSMYFGFNPDRAWTQEGVAFDGMIDDVRIYNRALSESEIQSLYNETSNMCSQADLDAAYNAGKQACIADPASCGIPVGTGGNQCGTVTTDFLTPTVHFPCLNIGGTNYWLDLGIYSTTPTLLLNITNYGQN
jgi:Concanavalin A-like lectin/glucanases superfamily